MKTGLLEVRPIFVRKAPRTRAHELETMLALKVVREMRREVMAAFGATDHDQMAVPARSSDGCSRFLLHQCHPSQPAPNSAHASHSGETTLEPPVRTTSNAGLLGRDLSSGISRTYSAT